jgi:hypothetical protein
MEGIEQNSYSYYRLYEKIALVSLLKKEMSKHSNTNKTSGINSFSFDFINLSFLIFDFRQFKLYQE